VHCQLNSHSNQIQHKSVNDGINVAGTHLTYMQFNDITATATYCLYTHNRVTYAAAEWQVKVTTPDDAEVSCECQATTETVNVVGHVRTQVDVVENNDVDVRKIDANEWCACRHQQTCDTTVTVEPMHHTATLLTLLVHRSTSPVSLPQSYP